MEEIYFGKLTLVTSDYEPGLTISACEEDVVEIDIPAKVNGIPVIKIGDRAFANCRKLQKVNFPEYEPEDYLNDEVLREIGGNSFMDCSSLIKLELPETVTFIGHGAFYYCTALKKITFNPRAYVSACAFAKCTSLKEVTPVSQVNEGVFSHCESLTSLPITSKVDEIGEDAFEHCDGLTEILIPKQIESIGSLAFRNAMGLKRVIFEEKNGWYWHCRYDGKNRPINVSDPEKNAHSLKWQDFDDGVSGWYRK
ncbi:MAG: leucine-rich repeat domain-containing protein [Clostridia bacterium]|nr:leucine-rich repeat domain-containing protein [Clostridia bacterium]